MCELEDHIYIIIEQGGTADMEQELGDISIPKTEPRDVQVSN